MLLATTLCFMHQFPQQSSTSVKAHATKASESFDKFHDRPCCVCSSSGRQQTLAAVQWFQSIARCSLEPLVATCSASRLT